MSPPGDPAPGKTREVPLGIRRAATAVLCALLALAVLQAPGAASASSIADVPATSRIAFDVAWATGHRVISARPDGTFLPDAAVSRQSLALYLYRLVNGPSTNPSCRTKPFADVPVSSSYCGEIAWLRTRGIVTAGAGTAFRPTATVPRQTLAGYLYRLVRGTTPPARCARPPYPDVPASASTCGAIAWFAAQGLDNYPTSGPFHPGSAVLRGQLATILHRTKDVLQRVLGADVSYPQCDGALPTGQAFGVVGVNGGKPTTWNRCLTAQLAWAKQSPGTTGQPPVQLFVNTANPGGLNTPSWPRTGKNGYGTCTGSNSTACAYQYGIARAKEDAAHVAQPQTYTWWLDVELLNTWDTTPGGTARNVAVLEGMVNYFRSVKVTGVGLYATASHWRTIVGSSVSASSPLIGLPNWLPGASNLGGARRACGSAPLTSRGTVRMTQYTDTFDRNHSCV